MDLKIVNKMRQEFLLSDNPYFHLINVDGQTTATSKISSLVIGGIDGDIANNVQAQPRSLIFTLRVKNGVNVEDAKRAVLQIVKLKQTVSVYWTQNARIVKIDGIVESVDMPRWNNAVALQISLHCEQPFWEDIDALTRDINEAKALHYFTEYPNDMLIFPEEGIPFGEYDFSRTRDINNTGDVGVGMIIEILAVDTVTNPIIQNQSGEFFGIGYGTGAKKIVMNAGDLMTISTIKGNKSVTMNGRNLFGYIKPRSTWLQLEAGLNTLAINSDDESLENMTFNLSFKRRYI